MKERAATFTSVATVAGNLVFWSAGSSVKPAGGQAAPVGPEGPSVLFDAPRPR